MPKEKVTEEKAAEALQQLALQEVGSETAPAAQAETEPSTEQPAAATEPVTEEAAPEAAAAESDDVTSLKKRTEELQAKVTEQEKLFDARWKALQQRGVQNEEILRTRYLRKATVADRALKILKASRTEQGVPEAEVDAVIREVESTMHPSSASYVPPESIAADVEDQSIVLNRFLNEKGMTADEQDEFGKWIRSDGATVLTPQEQAVAAQSLDGFLRLAHTRWQAGMKTRQSTRDDAVEAVRTVQRTQREAARAASAPAAAPRKQPASPKATVDLKKLTKRDISELLRQSVEQYD